MSFQQGLSGLNGAQKSLDAISNNVANSNTAGFKAAQTQFADVYAISLAGGGAGAQTGIGVNVAGVSQQFSQGSITVTNNPLDLAINGAGFYRMSNAGSISYTRNGQFTLDKDGYIVNPAGYRLTGYGAGPTGGVVDGVFADLRVKTSQGTPQATSKVEMALNLDARAAAINPAVTPFDISNPLSYTSGTSLSVFDSQGFPHTLSLFAAKRSPNTWDMYQCLDLG
ncbi:MAG TPA: flagellar hook-basal body complex protein, partial [Acidiferrobacterales bacterium]|nr:flagellar hook-basal body complex protein [Acidiferrobacterales bacterium]